MQSISSHIQGLYQSHSRAVMNDVLPMCVFDACVSNDRMPERLIQELVMLIAVLHGNVGPEVGRFNLVI